MRVPSIILLGLSGLLAGPTLAQGRSHEGVVSAALQSEDPAAALEALRGTIPPEAPLNLIDAGFLVVDDQPGPQVTSGQLELLTAHLMMTEAGRVAASLRRPTDADLSLSAREARLELWGWCATARDLDVLLDLLPEDEASPRLARALESALGELLGRDPLTFQRARGAASAHPHAERVLIRALGSTGDARALQALTPFLIGNGLNLDASLAAITDLARSGVPTDWAIADAARDHLDAQASAVRTAATTAAGALYDGAAVPALIVLLDDEVLSVRRAARRALQEMSGLPHGHDPARWRSWYGVERRWLETDWVVLRETLRTGDVTDVLAAIGRVAAHRLDRRLLAAEVRPLLNHDDQRVRAFAARALGEIGDRGAIPALVTSLSDPTTRSAARAALVRMTGRDLPPEPQAWRDALGLEP